jgi:plasmid maintenance system killer protein
MEERNAQRVSPLKSVGLHPLKGNRRDHWAITVNEPWRICFRFKDGDAYRSRVSTISLRSSNGSDPPRPCPET